MEISEIFANPEGLENKMARLSDGSMGQREILNEVRDKSIVECVNCGNKGKLTMENNNIVMSWYERRKTKWRASQSLCSTRHTAYNEAVICV